MLLGLGPTAFADQVTELALPHAHHLALRLIPRLLELSLSIPASLVKYLPDGAPEKLQHLARTAATQLQHITDAFALKQAQRAAVSTVFGSSGAAGSTGATAALSPAPPEELNATEKMQQRVLMLQAIRAALSEAIARVHAAARLLQLDVHVLGRVQRAKHMGTLPAASFAASGVAHAAVAGADDGSKEVLLVRCQYSNTVVNLFVSCACVPACLVSASQLV